MTGWRFLSYVSYCKVLCTLFQKVLRFSKEFMDNKLILITKNPSNTEVNEEILLIAEDGEEKAIKFDY